MEKLLNRIIPAICLLLFGTCVQAADMGGDPVEKVGNVNVRALEKSRTFFDFGGKTNISEKMPSKTKELKALPNNW
jgi:hypothetical protein